MLYIGRGSLKLLKRSLKGLVQTIRKMAVKKTIIKQQIKMSCLRRLEYRSWCLVSICRLHPFSRMLWRKTSFLRHTSQIFFYFMLYTALYLFWFLCSYRFLFLIYWRSLMERQWQRWWGHALLEWDIVSLGSPSILSYTCAASPRIISSWRRILPLVLDEFNSLLPHPETPTHSLSIIYVKNLGRTT